MRAALLWLSERLSHGQATFRRALHHEEGFFRSEIENDNVLAIQRKHGLGFVVKWLVSAVFACPRRSVFVCACFWCASESERLCEPIMCVPYVH